MSAPVPKRDIGGAVSRYSTVLKRANTHAAIVVLDMPLLDTREQPDGITGTFMADLVLQILSYVAQLERENIKQRQAEGIASARLRGVRFGRPALERPDSYRDVIRSFEGGEVTRQEAAMLLNVSASTFDRWRRADANGYDRSPSVRPL